MNATAAPGESREASAADHVHPSDTSKIDIAALGQPGGPAMLDSHGNFAGLAFVFGSANFIAPAGFPTRPYTSPDTQKRAYIAGGDYTAEYPDPPGTKIWEIDQDGTAGNPSTESVTYDAPSNTTIVTCDCPGSFGTSGYVSSNPGSVFACGAFNTVSGLAAYAEGLGNTSSGLVSHAEGFWVMASGDAAHAEGTFAAASGDNSHAEGYLAGAVGFSSHAEGSFVTAGGDNSHAEGVSAQAAGIGSHAEGSATQASGQYSHAEGF